MTEHGGTATQVGINYQNSITALYLGRLCDPTPRDASERIVEVRVEAMTVVDDTVVTYADGHRLFIQVKENIRDVNDAWRKLWKDFEEQFWNSDFQHGKDRLLLQTGEVHDEHHELKEMCERAEHSKDHTEWLMRLNDRQRIILRKIKSRLAPSHSADPEILFLLRHVEVEIISFKDIDHYAIYRFMPHSNRLPKELFRLLRDRVAHAAGRRGWFTTNGLLNELRKENVLIEEQPDIAELRSQIRGCSAGLRQHKYTFGNTGRHLSRAVVGEIVEWARTITAPEPVALLLDRAGMGKTVVAHDVLCNLEGFGTTTLAIKADLLSGITTAEDLQRHLRLSDSVERVVERITAHEPMVILIDQIDALSLSLARDEGALKVVLDLIARLRLIHGVRILISCRTFDLHSDPKLRQLDTGKQFHLVELSNEEVRDVLQAIGMDFDKLTWATQKLLRTPLHLDLFAWAMEEHPPGSSLSAGYYQIIDLQELYSLLWRNVICKSVLNGPEMSERERVIELLTARMEREQRTVAPQSTLTMSASDSRLEKASKWLASEGILIPSGNDWTFFHQTFFDYCYAKQFVEEGRNLFKTISESDQGLFARPQIIQVLTYLRSRDPATYIRELNSLLNAVHLRLHLRDLVLRWFGSLQGPTDAEWVVARRMLAKLSQRPKLLAVMGGNRDWFDRLKISHLQSLMMEDEQTLDHQVLPYLASMLDVAQAEVINLIRPYLGRDEQWNRRLRWMLSRIRDWHTIEAADLFERMFLQVPASEVKNIRELNKIAKAYPQTGCRLIRAAFDRLLGGTYAPQQNGRRARLYSLGGHLEAFNGSTIVKALEAVSEVEPKLFLESMLPWLEQVLELSALSDSDQHDYYKSDAFSLSWYDSPYVVQHQLRESFILALVTLARNTPDDFRRIAEHLAAQPFETCQRLLAHTYRALPDVYAGDAVRFLVADRRRLNLGENEQYDTRQLIKAIHKFLSAEQWVKLENAILSYCPIHKVYRVDGLRRRGLEQFHLLQSIPSQRLTERGRRRLRELERKFPEHRAAENPSLSKGGLVGPPIPDEATRRMSDRAWLRAMSKYQGNITHKDFLKGGAQELSSLLKERVKEDPQRFCNLAMHVPLNVDEPYIRAFIDGLAESAGPAELLFEVVRRFALSPVDEVKRTISHALAKRVDDQLPDDLIDMLEEIVRGAAREDEDWWLRNEQHRSRDDVRSRSTLNDGPYSSYLNSVRGTAMRTLMRALDARAREGDRERQWDLVQFVSMDSSTALRSGAIEELHYLVNSDRERAISIFEILMQGHPSLLRSHYTSEFVYYGFYKNYLRLKPFIIALMNESYENIQQRGAELAGIASISIKALESAEAQSDAQELAARTLTGPPSWRRGAARIYAYNIASEVSEICVGRLTRLLNDEDDQVRRLVSGIFEHLQDEHINSLSEFIAAYAASSSLHEGADQAAEFLFKHGELNPAWSLSIIEIMLNNDRKRENTYHTFGDGDELIRLVLRLHADPFADAELRGHAMDIFDKLMERFAFDALSVLRELDQG